MFLSTGPNTRFEFERRYECNEWLEHYKLQKILQIDRSFVFCVIFSPGKYVLL